MFINCESEPMKFLLSVSPIASKVMGEHTRRRKNLRPRREHHAAGIESTTSGPDLINKLAVVPPSELRGHTGASRG